MVGSEGGEDAHRMEDKTTTTTLLSSSSSLVSLRCVHAPPRPLSRSWRWGRACVSLSFVGAGRSTAVVGGLRGCWAVDVVRWVLAVVRRSLSPLRVVVHRAVVVFYAAGFVYVGGCVT